MKDLLKGLGIIALIGFFILLYRWITCKNGCPSMGLMGMPCKPQNCSFWTGNPVVDKNQTSANSSISQNPPSANSTPVVTPKPNPVTTLTQLEVSNPNGASIYYQSAGQFGGYIYSPSNISLPLGTKLVLIKPWYTLSNNYSMGYYETNKGFFDIKDVKKS